jgi:hypothetical protein
VTVDALSRKGSKGFLSRLKLSFGKVLSQVEKLASSHSSFEVEAGGVVCGVRGTAFEVSADGDQVTDSTFEGKVEMRKGGRSQMVPVDRHSEFAGDKGVFLAQRLVNDREKARYDNWRRFEELAVQRQAEREKAVKAFEALDKPERNDILEGLEKVRSRDRFLILRRIMRESNLKDRRRILDDSVRARVNAMQDRDNIRQKALEEREKNLRKKHKDN